MSETYRLWQEWIKHFPKTSRYTLGSKIDALFIEIIDLVVTATHLNSQQKLPFVRKATFRLDVLKFFLHLAWEARSLDNKKYVMLSERLDEVGRMLGGWNKQLSLKEKPTVSGK